MSQGQPPKINATKSKSSGKELLANLSKSAGAATKLVGLQTERKKLATFTLPAAYGALGRDCLQNKRHLDGVTEFTSQLRSVLSQIKELSEATAAQPTPQSFTDKAKAASKQALDVARTKQLGMKRDSLIASIGKSIYEQHRNESGPIELVATIESVLARVSSIEVEIDEQSQVGKGTFVTPKRILLGGAAALVLVGTYLVFPRTSGDADWSAQLAQEESVAIAKHEPVFLQMLEAGDSAWDAGKKDDAVQHYSQLLAQFCGYGQSDRTAVANLHKSEMARAAGRAIDFLADSGNDETAKDLIKKADQSDLVIVYRSPKANRLVIEAKADQAKEDRETDEWLENPQEYEMNFQSAAPSSSSTGTTSDVDLMNTEDRFLALVNQVRPGMSKQRVEAILGVADESDEQDMGDLNPQKAGQSLDISKWHGDTEAQSSIVLSFVNGQLQDGGTPGYDIRKGFTSGLPGNLSSSEAARLEAAAAKLGIHTSNH